MDAKADIKPLTGLRGAAALAVAAYHLLLPGALIHGTPARLLGRAYLAVDIFFILSGFVLALNYGAWFTQGAQPAACARFLWRRFARIYPLYVTILAARLIYTQLRYGTFALPRPWIAVPLAHPAATIAANLAMVQAWGVAPSITGPSWSISAECAAYIAFPLLAAAMLGRRHARIALACIAASALLLVAVTWLPAPPGHPRMLDVSDGETPGPLMRCLAGFIIGIAICRLAAWAPARRLAAHPASTLLVLLALAALLLTGASDLAIYPLFPALVLCLACARTGPAMLLARPAAVWLGEISYALYLLHIFLLHPIDVTRAAARLILPPACADAATSLGMLALLLAAAHVATRLIDEPGRRFLSAPPHARLAGSAPNPMIHQQNAGARPWRMPPHPTPQKP